MNTLDIQYTYTQQNNNSHTKNMININTHKEDKNIIPLRKRLNESLKERSDKASKKRKNPQCIYCSRELSDEYSFCPECGNEIPKKHTMEELYQMKERYHELEKSNQDLEKKLKIHQQKQIYEEAQRENDLMWLVASIPTPQFSCDKIELKDYTIRKISPAFSEFMGFQHNKSLINAKMGKILPSIPSHLSHIHSNHINDLSLKKDSVSYYKEEVFKNMYDELFLSTLQFNLYCNDRRPSLCIIVLTSISKLDSLDSALPNLHFPFLSIG
eukprot:TRINITY_DN2322_c0_g1_i1.p1 TRINITY_DN2322_c0_g1~~TRINITY_DN2322_c0_g1_i1.p1  ORF type:complete len:270 (-),score=62.54 TRINITY_DN2322_c0_g1_i1:50-859(-)